MEKKTLVGPCAGRVHRACALILCAMLASCGISPYSRAKQQLQESIFLWQAAGSPVAVSCRYPFGIETPRSPGSTQAYPSLRDFLPVAVAAQAPIWECVVIAGSDDAAQIAGAGWGSLGYAPLHVWRPTTAFIDLDWGSEVVLTPMPGMEKFYKYSGPPTTYETQTESEKTSVAYGAWYLGYQRIPQGDEQARRQGTGLYAMQGFRCAIHMRDFLAARRYWALAISSNPGSAAAYGQIALQSFFQRDFERTGLNDSGSGYLNLPQDIREDIWNAAGQRYSAEGRIFSMVQVEKDVQTGRLNETLRPYVPKLSVLYCPVFYPGFDPIPPIISVSPIPQTIYAWDFQLRIPADMLNSATQRAAGESGKEQ